MAVGSALLTASNVDHTARDRGPEVRPEPVGVANTPYARCNLDERILSDVLSRGSITAQQVREPDPVSEVRRIQRLDRVDSAVVHRKFER